MHNIEITVCERDANGNPTGRVYHAVKPGVSVVGEKAVEDTLRYAQKGVKCRKARSRIRQKLGASYML